MNSHILQEVELVCDRVAIMSQGQLRGIGRIEELTNHAGGRELVVDVGYCRESANSAIIPQSIDELAVQVRNRIEPIYCGSPVASSLSVAVMPDARLRIKVLCDSQALTDATVDVLRHDGYSIIGLRTNRRTLEDVFLALVEPPESQGAIRPGNPMEIAAIDSTPSVFTGNRD